MNRFRRLAILLAVVVAACGSDSASYLVDGDSDNAFSLFRDKAIPGGDWNVALALTHLPDCQRRYALKSVAGDAPFKAELFRNAAGFYLLHTAGTWYEAQLDGCLLQQIKSAPATPGDAIGAWEQRDARLMFFPAGK
jgi:hypothetical protein